MEHKWRWSLPEEALRKHGGSQTEDRIWARLEQELPATRGFERKNRWVPMSVAAAFLVGVWVGSASFGAPQSREAANTTPLHAEPIAMTPAASRPTQLTARRNKPAAEHAMATRKRRVKRTVAAETVQPQDNSETSADSVLEPGLVAAPQPSVEVAAQLPKWQSLAEQGDYEDALAEISRDGGFDTALAAADGEQLMLLVDVARATGQRQLAIVALRRVVDDHKVDPLAPLAAWSLGVMLEKEGDRPGAAAAYGVYRALSPQGDFAEDALARQVRISLEVGDLGQAASLAQLFVSLYPDAPSSTEFRKWLSERHASEGAGASQDGDEAAAAAPPKLEEREDGTHEGAAGAAGADEGLEGAVKD